MHQKSPIMWELYNNFKQKLLMFQFIKLANYLLILFIQNYPKRKKKGKEGVLL